MFPATLAAYVPLLRATDDLYRLRLVAHEFGLRWEDRVHSPAAFEAHGTLIAERELAVV